jgi:HK97 family phage prohead protease
VRLYEDLEPVCVQGYAATFDSVYTVDGGRAWERIATGAFALGAGRPVFLDIAHVGTRLASTADGSLRVWQDRRGLAFEAATAWDAAGLTLVKAIRRGEFTGASFAFGRRDAESVVEHGREVEVVLAAEIGEISLTWEPANPCTAIWLADDRPDDMPAHAAAARARWEVGRMEARLAAARARARASARAVKPVCPRSVVTVLDRYRGLVGGGR